MNLKISKTTIASFHSATSQQQPGCTKRPDRPQLHNVADIFERQTATLAKTQELIEQGVQEKFLEAVEAGNEDLAQDIINGLPTLEERERYVLLMYERIGELELERKEERETEQELLEALKQDDWSKVDAYYDRYFQGTSVFNVDYGSPITLDDLEPADIAELKAKDAATATPLELLDEAQLFDMDMDYKTPGLLGWVDRQARKRLVEIQQAIAAAERIKATQPNI